MNVLWILDNIDYRQITLICNCTERTWIE
jgi:hypothetical protein